MKHFFLSVLFICFFIGSSARDSLFTKQHHDAFDLITSLRFIEAEELITDIKRTDKDDITVILLENYIDAISIFISEDEGLFNKQKHKKNQRLERLKRINNDSPLNLYTEAEILLQWAVARIKFGEYVTAALEVNRAIKLLNKNKMKYPGFVYNHKSLSLLHAISGTIPRPFKSIVSTISNFEGTIQQGIDEIDSVLEFSENNEYLYKNEAIIIKTILLQNLENNPDKAYIFFKSKDLDVVNNPLLSYIMANVAQRSGRNDEAISILEKRGHDPRSFPFYYLDYFLGNLKLSKGDNDANIYLKSYLKNFKGRNYIKETYRKLAWYELIINQDEKAYTAEISKCLSEGFDIMDEDKAARKEARSGIIPDHELLKARILFDGSYFGEALYVIDQIQIERLDKNKLIEYYYRKGRILEKLDQNELALETFQSCINSGSGSKAYYICNSHILRGNIFEFQKKYPKARKEYKAALRTNPSEYQRSLHQKAKAGLIRIK